MRYLLILIVFLGKVYSQEALILTEEIVGKYKFKNSYYIEYKDWKKLKEADSLSSADYYKLEGKKIKLQITKEKNIYDDYDYFLELKIGNKILHKYFISDVDYRYTYDDAYDILSGDCVFTLFKKDDVLMLYHEYNFEDRTFNKLYVFEN